MRRADRSTTYFIAGLFALGIAAGAAWLFISGSSDKTSPAHLAEDAPIKTIPLEAWEERDAPELTLKVHPERGPEWRFSEANSQPLTPAHPDLQLSSWRVQQRADITQIVGEGQGAERFSGAGIRVIWTVAAGNPTAHIRVELDEVPANLLAHDISLPLEFSAGELQLGRASASGVSTRATWELPEEHERAANTQLPARLQVSAWSGDGLKDDQKPTLHFKLWDATRRPGYQRCADSDEELKTQLSADFLLTFGDAQEATTWPYPEGSSAALSPIFGIPAHHHDPLLAETAAPDARRWLLRAKTLIYGHSNPEDPRYANGGILGNELGATIIYPAEFIEDKEVQELTRALENTQVELVPWGREESGQAAAQSSRVGREPNCADLIAMQTDGVAASINLEDKPDQDIYTQFSAPGALPAQLTPEVLDGRLETLLAKGFDTDALNLMLKAQQNRAFLAPFIATRNPLIEAAHQSLLVPEPWGHWRLTETLDDALTNLGLWRETAPVQITSVGRLANYQQASRRVQIWWDQKSNLRIYNPGEAPVRGYTLFIPEELTEAQMIAYSEPEDGANEEVKLLIQKRPLAAGSLDSEQGLFTLLWWDLPPGITRLSLQKDGAAQSAAAPKPVGISWRIEPL